MDDNLQTVRRLWAAFESGGVEAMLEQVGPDVVWEPFGAAGRALGNEGLRAFQAGPGGQSSAAVYAFEQQGDCVLASGSLRVETSGGFSERQLFWVYFFGEGELRRAASFASRESASAAMAAFGCGA